MVRALDSRLKRSRVRAQAVPLAGNNLGQVVLRTMHNVFIYSSTNSQFRRQLRHLKCVSTLFRLITERLVHYCRQSTRSSVSSASCSRHVSAVPDVLRHLDRFSRFCTALLFQIFLPFPAGQSKYKLSVFHAAYIGLISLASAKWGVWTSSNLF